MGTLVAALRAGRTRGLVGITFDDGYISVLETRVPELLRHGFTATVFVVSDRLGGTNEWDAARPGRCCRPPRSASWPRPGWRSARTAPRTPAGRHRAGQLAAEVGGERASSASSPDAVRGFAYPYGDMDAAARRAVRDAGYDYACAVATPAPRSG